MSTTFHENQTSKAAADVRELMATQAQTLARIEATVGSIATTFRFGVIGAIALASLWFAVEIAKLL